MNYAFVCFSVLACAFAAPQYQHQGSRVSESRFSFHSTRNVTIGNGEEDIEALMERLKKEGIGGFSRSGPDFGNSFKDGVYKVEFDLQGFEENDIDMVVKPGTLKVVAEHVEGNKQMHVEATRSLPSNLDLTSSSAEFKDGKLKITFGVKKTDNII